MNELEHLKSMWQRKIRRSTKLIVPQVTYSSNLGSLNNERWKFKVSYAFRDALDIKYDQRVKDKKPYKVWTQGPILNFCRGGLLEEVNKERMVQVLFASSMGWDTSKGEMYAGSVVYEEYGKQVSCTQMQFLKLLICGQYDVK